VRQPTESPLVALSGQEREWVAVVVDGMPHDCAHHMALTPDHSFLVVGDTTANELLFLNPVTGGVEKRMPVTDSYQFGYSPDGKWLVVNGLLRNQVDIFDASTMQLANRVPVSAMPQPPQLLPGFSDRLRVPAI
jgi:hypothetical protein